MRAILFSIFLTALAPTAISAEPLFDHPAVAVQRLHARQGYDYASKFYPHPAYVLATTPQRDEPAAAEPLFDHPAVAAQRLHARQGYDYASKFYPHPAYVSATTPQRDEPAAAHEAETTLYHPFMVASPQQWADAAIELKPQGWRVGRIDGPPASEAQLRAALGHLRSIEIGARCAGWVQGPTSYPCAVAVEGLDLADAVAQRFGAIRADAGDAIEPAVRAAAGNVSAELRASSLIAPVLDAPRFVGVVAPSHYLGDQATAFGGALKFRFRVLSNPLVPSQIDRSSGAVILRGGDAGVWQASTQVIRRGE